MQASKAEPGPNGVPGGTEENGPLSRLAVRMSNFSERWFPEAYIFALIALVVVTAAALSIGASPAEVTEEFGNGFWDLIPFAMQMAFVAIGGYVVATAPVAHRLIARIAAVPSNAPRAIALIATVSTVSSLFNWGFSLIFAGLLARQMARRDDLKVDYRAAGAAAFMGLGSVWAGHQLLGGPAPGQPRKHPREPASDHRGHPLPRHHLPVAVHADRRRADRHRGDRRLLLRTSGSAGS